MSNLWRNRLVWLALPLASFCLVPAVAQKPPAKVININPPHISTDKSVKYDFDIVYVRGTRRTDGKEAVWAEFSHPERMEPGADLMLLHPDGSEEVLVSGKDGSVLDPYVSFDGEWVFYAKYIDPQHTGSNIYKMHIKSRKIVKLTDQTFTPNTGAADWSKVKLPYGVYNLGPCPVPGGKVVFTSNRNAHVPPRGYPRIALQLFIMDEDGANVEQIGYLNIACALHPVILKDGRIIFSSLESQGLHNAIMWGIWSIHPDGTNWGPIVSALPEGGAPSGFHFQTQLSDESIIVERYYNQNQKGFGTLFKLPPTVPPGVSAFGPGDRTDPRNRVMGLHPKYPLQTISFTPYGMQSITPWIHFVDNPAPPADPADEKSPRIGKVTHPCGAPDNHLLVAWTLGPIGGSAGAVREYMQPRIIDSGIYLIKGGGITREPGDMLLIKNDPKYNEQWPRPVVPYKRLLGVDEPKRLVHANNGKRSPHLPEGTPYGLVGTSSLYKRESAPGGKVPEGSVTAVATDWALNWSLQGSDAGTYDNSEIHAIRILVQEPLSAVRGSRTPLYGSHANERLRILGEIPVRKFVPPGAKATGLVDGQPVDPDGNPDTSFLAKIPANQAFTFQTLDKNGMVLNMAQTWHQLRPGEIRNDCGGCHAHSQQPTPFEKTAAARKDYVLFDLTQSTPLITSKANDQSGKKWDKNDETGLRYEPSIKNVEYYRDIRPILERSCVACHSHKQEKPAGGLILDDDALGTVLVFGADAVPSVYAPRTYARLAGTVQFRRHEVHGNARPLGDEAATRYINKFQSRRSLLIWKLYGKRMDGTTNDDRPSEEIPGDPKSLRWRGKPVEKLDYHNVQALEIYIRNHADNDLTGSIMPPPEAVAGTYKGADGKPVKVAPLTDEDRRTMVRWIDLGCPIDLDPNYDPAKPHVRSYGWMGDDQRPTLTLTYPAAGANPPLTRILVGMADAYTGLNLDSFTVTADFAVDGVPAGQNLASKFKAVGQGIWELKLTTPIAHLPAGKLTVSVQDRQGNRSEIVRTFSVGKER